MHEPTYTYRCGDCGETFVFTMAEMSAHHRQHEPFVIAEQEEPGDSLGITYEELVDG